MMTSRPSSPGGACPGAGGASQAGGRAADAAAGHRPSVAGVIRIRLLGRFAVRRDAEEIPLRAFGGSRARQLLRLLALRRGTLISKDVIAEALWPVRPPADASGNIEVLVSRIRRAVGDRTLIQTGPGGYVLADDGRCQVDAEAFLAAVEAGRTRLAGRPAEALASFRAALDTWGGEPLAEDAYLEWAQEDRRHLSLAFLEALEGAATAALVTGNPAAAAAWAGQAQAREPLRETSAMLVVRALAASGDQAGALAAFDSFRRRLAGDAGLDPSPDAREIRQRVLLGRPLPAGPGRRPASRPAQPLELDDLHWADPASLILLGLILRRAGRVSMVAAYRPDGPAASFAAAETLGMPGEQVGHITLRPQPADAIRDLAGDPLPAEVILEQAGCTPLAVTEAVATATGHAAVHRDLDGRRPLRSPGNIAEARAAATAGLRYAVAARLPGRWRELLSVLALLGRPAPPALLAGASGTKLRGVLDALEGLARAGLAHPGAQGWTLSHELSGQALAGVLRPAEKARLHALIAQALRDGAAEPAEIAGHLAASGDRAAAAAAYATAATRQLERIRDDETLRLAETGLSLDPPRPTRALLLEARAEAHRRRGRLPQARTDLESALGSLDDAPGRSRVLAHLAILEARTGDTARGDQLAGLAIAEAGGQPHALGEALAAAAIIDLAAGNLTRAERRSRRARRLVEQAGGSRAGARLLYCDAMACFTGGRLGEAITQLGDLAQLPVTPAEMLRLWSPRATRGHALAFLAQAQAGLAEIDETLAWARAARHLAVQSECLWHRSEALAILGRAGEAAEAAQEAVGIATCIRHAEWAAASLRGLGIAWEAAGMADRAESAYRRSLRAAEGRPLFTAWASARLGACLARQGRPQDAAAHVDAAVRRGTPLTAYEARWAGAELLAARGDADACRAAAADALRAAQGGGYLILVPRLRVLAES